MPFCLLMMTVFNSFPVLSNPLFKPLPNLFIKLDLISFESQYIVIFTLLLIVFEFPLHIGSLLSQLRKLFSSSSASNIPNILPNAL